MRSFPMPMSTVPAVSELLAVVLVGALVFGAVAGLGTRGRCGEAAAAATQFTDAQLEEIRAGMERRAREHQRLYLQQPFDVLPKLLDNDALAQAQWIWRANELGRVSAPVGIREFRRGVEIPADRQMVAAHCALAADNTYRLFVNGKQAGQGGGFSRQVVRSRSLVTTGGQYAERPCPERRGRSQPGGFAGRAARRFRNRAATADHD